MAVKEFLEKRVKVPEADDLEFRVAVFIWIAGLITFAVYLGLTIFGGWKPDFLTIFVPLLIGTAGSGIIIVVIDYFWPGPFGDKGLRGYDGSNFYINDMPGKELAVFFILLILCIPLSFLIVSGLRRMGIKGVPFPTQGRPLDERINSIRVPPDSGAV